MVIMGCSDMEVCWMNPTDNDISDPEFGTIPARRVLRQRRSFNTALGKEIEARHKKAFAKGFTYTAKFLKQEITWRKLEAEAPETICSRVLCFYRRCLHKLRLIRP